MAHTNNDESKKIPLGSGTVYISPWTGEMPDDETLETDSNMLGRIQGGATIEYKPSYYSEKSDDGLAQKTIITAEEAMLKLGIIAWNGEVLGKCIDAGTLTESNGKRVLKIGGIGNQKFTDYVVRFVGGDDVDGVIRITIVGSNQAGFSLGFVKDKGTAINPEFTARPIDDSGTLIIYEEEILNSSGYGY